ncbi:MAG TPA: prepilin peptidase, partial [Planctomycetaceae bacterium]|nr:prepilin peptidase [Planctomycetaceae bacterium]
MAILSACLDATIAVWFFSFGACVGSFLNVVAYRLPLGLGNVGDSKCPDCGSRIDG